MTHRARHRRASARDASSWNAASLARVLATCLACARACASVEASNGFGSSRHLLAASKYFRGDDVPLFANKVGPFHNPSEVRARARLGRRCATREGRDYSDAALTVGLRENARAKTRRRERASARIRGLTATRDARSRRSLSLVRAQTYKYYDYPFCQTPGGAKRARGDLGDVLGGDRLARLPHEIAFRVDVEDQTLCTQFLERKEVDKFRRAVKNDYYFQMTFDDLPIWGFIGKVEKILRAGATPQNRYFLFTHVHFEISYNEDRVIEINLSTDPLKTIDITADEEMSVRFSYSVQWKPTSIEFKDRMDKYSRYSFLPEHMEIHWFSIINSCVTVLLMMGFLASILLRVLKKDFVKFAQDEEMLESHEESGWKYVHGDVFRFPRGRSLFAAIIGTGTQLLFLVVFVFVLAAIGAFYPYSTGAVTAACLIVYSLTAGIAGYVSALTYRQMGGENWVRNVLLTCVLFCGPLGLLFAFLNTIAIAYRSTAALPFGTIVLIVFVWAIVTIPLTIVGGIVGKNTKTDFNAPTRTTKYPREIPELPWYRSTIPQMCVASFLPFTAIYIELFYIFASVWGHKVYTIYSVLFVVFVILILVTAFTTISLTYFQLTAEDHEWWWRSLLCGGSTGISIFAYAVYYFHVRSDMTGFMQSAYYFGYMSVICYGWFLALGTVGHKASLTFVRHIYGAIKCD